MKSVPLKDALTALISNAFKSCGLPEEYGDVRTCNDPRWGQFQCNGALAVAKAAKRNPKQIAQDVIHAIAARELFEDLTVSGPGFIVMTLSEAYLRARLETMAADPRLGVAPVASPQKVIIDFGGPNVAKPMHVGHLRSTVIGDCLQRLFGFMGNDVQSDIHLGDWGLPMGMLIAELENNQPHLPYFAAERNSGYPAQSPVSMDDLEALYPAASQRCRHSREALAAAQKATAQLQNKRPGYLALWRHFVSVSNAALEKDFSDLGVHFDLWHGESRYHERIAGLIQRLSQQKTARLSDGAMVIPVARETDKRPVPPLILRKRDGSYLYDTTDLATLEERLADDDADRVLYVVDQRQHLHFERLFRAAARAGFKPHAHLEHLCFGTVNGTDGSPLKTRQGGTFRLNDLIAQVRQRVQTRMQEAGIAKSYDEAQCRTIVEKVAVATLKFADLMNNRTSDYIFDLDKFTQFDGKTGPYCLYSAVRIKSIVQKAAAQGIHPGPWIGPVDDVENDLRLHLVMLPDMMQMAFDRCEPHHLCAFAFDLARKFSRFYMAHHILNESNGSQQASWLSLSLLCARQLELVLDLLGIEIPERM